MSSSTQKNDSNDMEETYWNSAAGQKWVDFQHEMDSLLATVKDQLLTKTNIQKGEKILDVGCGTGATTRDSALLSGASGSVIGVDISALLLDCAKQVDVDPNAGSIDYLLADAQTHGFAEESLDVLLSRFGVMFFSDPVIAFANMARALKPGGRLHFVSWSYMNENPWFQIPRDVAIDQLGSVAPSDPHAPGPMAFADLERVSGILRDAGLQDVTATNEKIDLFYQGTLDAATYLACNVGPVMRVVKELGGKPEDVRAISEEIAERMQNFVVPGGLSIPASLNFYSACKE
ncbi:class I SAM-dependent methyltransferase [Sneathiella marina]|uniref:Class I SAM-dependent methyltransferase n=1 Tax=Sneathiella marina TaxID=2950108 RepID=A0ABY4W0W0_9PROT|nr:class I SAM-dependent methyltransferase [Sneathiella marina]USG60594.1 class I SAM-dependent methyltransferase [Sneathiella marina]